MLKNFSEMRFDIGLFLLGMFLVLLLVFVFTLIFFLFLFGHSVILIFIIFLFIFFVCLYLIACTQAKSNIIVISPFLSTRHMSMFLNPVHQSMNILISWNTLDIANKNKHSSSPSDSHIHSSPIFQKPNLPFWITSHHRYDDTLLLPALNAINCRYINQRHLFLSNYRFNQGDLFWIWGQYCYIFG